MTDAERQFYQQAAREWIGTPFHQGARVQNVGVDCAQLIIATALSCGLLKEVPINLKVLRPLMMPRKIRALLETYLMEIPIGTEKAGDIYWLYTRRNLPLHLAIVSDRGIIHASHEAGKVVETRRPAELGINSAWKFKKI